MHRIGATWACVAASAPAFLALPGVARAAEVIVVDGKRQSVMSDPSVPAALPLHPPAGRSVSAAGSRPHRPRGPSVAEVLAGAARRGAITGAERSAYLRMYRRAVAVRRRLGGTAERELGGALANLRAIAARRRLSPSRMPVLFLMLRRNAEFWPSHGRPPDRSQVMFAGSPLVFQYLAGEGLHFNPLATSGRANYYVRVCAARPPDRRKGTRCLLGRELLGELLRLAAQRQGFTSWEYYVDFGGGVPPWGSGIAQATALQALSKGSGVYGRPDYLSAARSAIEAFARRAPVGQRLRLGRGSHYLIYSFAPRLRVLNAFAQALNALWDFTDISGSGRGRALFQRGDRALRREIHRYDTGSWSLYSLRGYEASEDYHRLARDFLGGLCRRTGTDVYCNTARRFTSYLRRRGLSTAPGSEGL